MPIKHVIVIMEENESANAVIGSAKAPYLNGLANSCGLAANYHNTDHPSTPNYVELTSGTARGKAYSVDCAYWGCPQSQENIFDELTTAGETWKGYAESMPVNCDAGNTKLYAARHNPPQFYSDLHVKGSTSCSVRDVPLVSASSTTGGPTVTTGNFTSDVNNNTLPNLTWIAPNLCDDGHSVSLGPSYCTTNRIKNLDTWLAAWVPFILNSPEYASGNTELMILFDEGTGADKTMPEACWDQTHGDASLYPSCSAAAVFVGPNTPALASSTWFNHYDTLNAIASILGVPPFAGDATTGFPTGDDLRATFGL